jgi:septal ring factor EnvC (AmiA/AmiB activator)
LATDEGVKVTSAVADQVEATLTAALLDPECAKAVRSGLLLAALRSTGLESLDVAAAVALPEALGFTASPTAAEPLPPPDLHVVPDDEGHRKRDDAEEALAAAEAALAEADTELATAGAVVEELQARSLQVQSEIDELRRRLSDLESRAEETDDELSDAEETRDDAEAAQLSATKARDAARKALDKLG